MTVECIEGRHAKRRGLLDDAIARLPRRPQYARRHEEGCGGVGEREPERRSRQQNGERDSHGGADHQRGEDRANGDQKHGVECIDVRGQAADEVAVPSVAIGEREQREEAPEQPAAQLRQQAQGPVMADHPLAIAGDDPDKGKAAHRRGRREDVESHPRRAEGSGGQKPAGSAEQTDT